MNVGEAIKQFRKEAGFNQTQLAKLAGIQQAYISHIEAGTKTGTPHVIEKIASALEIPVAAIYVRAIAYDDLADSGNIMNNLLDAGKKLMLQALLWK